MGIEQDHLWNMCRYIYIYWLVCLKNESAPINNSLHGGKWMNMMINHHILGYRIFRQTHMEELSIVGELPIQCFHLLPGVLLDRVRDAKSGSKQPLHLALSWPWPHFYLCIRLWSAKSASSWSFPTRYVGLLPCSAEIWHHMNVISKILHELVRYWYHKHS